MLLHEVFKQNAMIMTGRKTPAARAKALGITPQTLAAFESGLQEISLAQSLSMSRAAHCSVGHLFLPRVPPLNSDLNDITLPFEYGQKWDWCTSLAKDIAYGSAWRIAQNITRRYNTKASYSIFLCLISWASRYSSEERDERVSPQLDLNSFSVHADLYEGWNTRLAAYITEQASTMYAMVYDLDLSVSQTVLQVITSWLAREREAQS